MSLQISAIYVFPLILLHVFLGWRVARFRREHLIGIGDKRNPELMMRMGAYNNGMENVPLLILLFIMLENSEAELMLLHGVGILLVFARYAHAWGVSHHPGKSFGRVYGTMTTWFLMIAMAIYLIQLNWLV